MHSTTTTTSSSRANSGHAVADIVPNTARSLLALLEDRGIPAERACRGLGFTMQDLMKRDLLLSHQQMRALILRAYRVLDDPAMGLAAGARQTPVSWGLPGLAMLTCETFGEAIEYGLEHQRHAGAMLIHRFEVTAAEAHVEVAPRLFDVRVEPFLVEESFAGALAIARGLVGQALRPLRVELAYARPVHGEAYRRLFHCPVRFDAERHRFSFESRWLEARLAGFDRVSCSLLREQLNTLLTRPLPGRVDLVESLSVRLRHGMEERPRQSDLAQAINVSDRTLRRRLGAQGTSYRAIGDDTRYQRARDLLGNTAMTVAQVAEAVGYADARAFRRAFKRWSGQLPAEYRAGR